MVLPVQTVDHVSHSVDEILVFLGVGDNDAVEPLHVGVDGVQSGGLSAACHTNKRATSAFESFYMNLYRLCLNWDFSFPVEQIVPTHRTLLPRARLSQLWCSKCWREQSRWMIRMKRFQLQKPLSLVFFCD